MKIKLKFDRTPFWRDGVLLLLLLPLLCRQACVDFEGQSRG